MRWSVIIPAINEQGHIRAAIESAHQAGASEVIVADGGSSDETRTIASSLGALVVESCPGRARQQNAGAQLASEPMLLFLHADSQLLIEPSLPPLATLFDQPHFRHGGLRQRIDSPRWAYRLIERGNALRARYRGLLYGDQALFMRRDFFDELGGFAELPLMEDVELSTRARQISWPVLLPHVVRISPRRWERDGIVRRTLKNWSLLARYRLGTSAAKLAAEYRRHDTPATDRTKS
ncbi:glycosyl transferase family 2 [Pirellula staleyi DSM 6068]|uniref:Glycosyl transferase family 2 n=1 Tax=Pirellula staleyi (strain ATCC 27377 / DSM 6068 / ICPB 4128) TaxID=530564 RepID=D2QZ66_PIRSD|nr:TIGR04283 family arsenosugar biosynthesis glycosyltransferase [Pirellula staleyi]ADB18258.1 glycosyl transferase family 2 [Pirellula staleyi DSM 6068]